MATQRGGLAFDGENLELHGAGRHNDVDDVARTLAEERLGKGRGDRDFGLLEVGLAFGDDGVDLTGVVLDVADGDFGE